MGLETSTGIGGIPSLPAIRLVFRQKSKGVDALLIEFDGHDSLLIECIVRALRVRIVRSRERIQLCVAALPESVQSIILTHEVEVLHLRVDNMLCNIRNDIRQGTVRDDATFSIF